MYIKKTVTDQIKILDRKIMQNEAEYDLDRKAAKISAFSSNSFDKYEYLKIIMNINDYLRAYKMLEIKWKSN